MQATAAQNAGPSGHPSQLLDISGRAFAMTYDGNGRLSAAKKASGRNIADMTVGYDANGRIERVRFDNGYQLMFHYRADGAEEVRDSLGGRLTRTGSPWITHSISDPSGYLAETLRRLEQLFGFVQAVPGLNAVPVPSSSQ